MWYEWDVLVLNSMSTLRAWGHIHMTLVKEATEAGKWGWKARWSGARDQLFHWLVLRLGFMYLIFQLSYPRLDIFWGGAVVHPPNISLIGLLSFVSDKGC